MRLGYSLAAVKQRLFLKNLEIELQLGKIRPPLAISWEATKECNLKCVHCGVEKSREKELSASEIKALIDELSKIGVRYFQITGGEPLLRNDLFEILGFVSERGMAATIATNGYFLGKDAARKLKGAKVALVQVSVDGTEKTHNKIRGNPESYAKAMQAIESLAEEKIPVAVATCVMPDNIGELEELKKILSEKNIGYWALGVAMPTGKARGNDGLFLQKKQFLELLEFIEKSKKEINVDLGENFPYLGKFDVWIRKKPKACPAGILSCCIGATGHVRACPDMPDTKENRQGNVLEERFPVIWKKGFRGCRERAPGRSDKKCASCGEWGRCYGGCAVMRIEKRHCILKYTE